MASNAPTSKSSGASRPFAALSRSTIVPVALALVAGCAGRVSPPSASNPASSAVAPADSPLVRAASKQLRSPDARAMSAPLPAGLPPELNEPLSGADLAHARVSLDDALAAIRTAAAAEEPPKPTERTPTDAERLEAVRSYVIGRAQRLAQEHEQAETTLKNAARLDPGSGPIWRELAESQEALGNRAAAISAFRRTLALDPLDISALDALSRAAIERGEWADAARLLDRLRTLALHENDPALPFLVSARLGRALAGLGYLSAAYEAMKQALDLPPTFGETTRFQSELGLLYRQRGDQWRDAGDGMLRLGDIDGASECYERAASLPNLNPSAMMPRRVYAQMRLGRPADAAAIVIDSLVRQQGRADDRLLGLLRYISMHSSVGPAAAATIDSIPAELSERERQSAASSLVRAKAACLDSKEAGRLLVQHLHDAPADDAAIRDLYARLDREDSRAVVEQTLELIAVAPLHEARYARAALGIEPSATKLIEILGGLASEQAAAAPARLLRARLLEVVGDYAAAERELAALLAAMPNNPPAVAARTWLLWRLGRADEARSLIDTLSESADPDARDARLLALTEIGDYEAASALITPMLPDLAHATPADVDRLLLGARIRMLSGEYVEAERLLQMIVLLEPTRDEAYSALLNLYSRNGPLVSEQKLVATIRSLRDNSPSSPTLRFLRAQEALQRGQLDIAERDLLDLADESPVRPGVVEGLIGLWKNLGRFEEAESWLRERGERRPEEPVFTVQLALLLDSKGRRTEAIALLDSRMARVPGDDQSSRVLEALLREDPSQSDRAQALTKARLARAPQTSEAMVELAELSASAGHFEEAAEAVRRTIDPARPLRPDLVARLAKLVVQESADALRGKSKLEPVMGLLDAVVEAVPAAPPGVYLVAVQMLARSGAPLQVIYDTIEAGVKHHPARRTEFFSAAFDALIRPGSADLRGEQRGDDAQALAEHACQTTKPPPLLLHTQWIFRAAVLGDGPSVARALRIARETETIDPLLDEMSKSAREPTGIADMAQQLAEFVNNNTEEEELVEWLYLTALRHKPDHIWANNNLGYHLLVEDREIERAVRYIEVSYETMMSDPVLTERAPITDSMGWARYKQGIFENEVGDDGAVIREGALTLLKRAYDLSIADPRYTQALPVIIDHYADALWAAGQREKAIELWNDAAGRAIAVVADLANRERDVPARVIAEIEGAGAGAQAKVEAAKSDRDPEIARIHPRASAAPSKDAAAPTGIIQ